MTSFPETSLLDDCWNRIGVRGDASCGELTRHVHCRNCPVYAGAAGRRLDAPLPSDHLDTWAAHYARPEEAGAERSLSAFLFRVGSEWLALPTSAFVEAAALRPVHGVPHRRGGPLLGVANIRGELLVCVSLARVLGLEEGFGTKDGTGRRDLRRLLVASDDAGRLVFPVEEVHGTERFRPSELQESPATVSRAAAPFARGVLPWRGASVGWLDPELLFAALNRSLA